MNLDLLGLPTREFQALRAQGLNTVEEVLARGPEGFAARPKTWSALSAGLERAARVQPELATAVQAFLFDGAALLAVAVHERQERRDNDPFSGLLPVERAMVQVLRDLDYPVPLRQFRSDVAEHFGRRLFGLKATVAQSGTMLVYPFGRHNWVGLQSWGREGYTKAARGAWSMLPEHLNRLVSEGRANELGPDAWYAVAAIAIEQGDSEIALLCRPFQPSSEARESEPVQRLLEEAAEREAVRLFAGLDPERDYQGAVESVVTRVREFPTPFSLAELEPTAGDLDWLKSWARSLAPYVVRGWLADDTRSLNIAGQRWSHGEGLGILILLLACEEARRRGQEGQIWNVVPDCFDRGTREELFAGGQPRGITRQAIEAGARRLRIHHAFGQEGRQSWYLTAFLQFGFTRNKISHLPLWLANRDQMTEGCLQLLEVSPVFAGLWEVLSRYRAELTDEVATRRALEKNPFVLNEWVPQILAAARQRWDSNVLELCDGELPLLGPARLTWSPPEPPQWSLSYFELNSHNLVDSGYEVEVAGKSVGRIVRYSDGLLKGEPSEISGTLTSSDIPIEILSDLGEDDREHQASVWGEEDDVVAYDAASGLRQRSEGNLSTSRSYIVILAPGLGLVPPARCQMTVANRGLHLLDEGWSAETEVVDAAGDGLMSLACEAQPDALAGVKLRYSGRPVELEEVVSLQLTGLPSNATLEWARFERQTLPTRPTIGGHDIEVQLPVYLTGSAVAIRICVSYKGRRYRLRLSADVDIFDASIHLDGTWRRFRDLPSLSSAECYQARCRFFLHHQEWKEPRHWAIMEGANFAGRPRARAARLSKPAGFGAALTLRPGPYNPGSVARCLVRSVVQRGRVAALALSRGEWTVWLHRGLQADEDHRVVLWNEHNELAIIGPELMRQVDGLVWKGNLPTGFSGEGETAAALAYRGACLGGAWGKRFQPNWELGSPRKTAALLRWFHIPLLQNRWLKLGQELARSHSQSCLAAWLVDRRVDGNPELELPDDSDDWFGVIRQILKGWNPDSAEAMSVWMGLLDQAGGPWALFELLLQADPVMTLKVVTRAGFSNKEVALFRHWASLGLSTEALIDGARKEMKVNEYFPVRLCEAALAKGQLDDDTRQNLEIAFQVRSFARLFAVKFLDHHLDKNQQTARR